jgi:hypothetical protein
MDRELVHELNNALLPVRAYGELALRKLARGEDPRPDIEEMLAAADRATALARRLHTPEDDDR